jgi:hypothetical protein
MAILDPRRLESSMTSRTIQKDASPPLASLAGKRASGAVR